MGDASRRVLAALTMLAGGTAASLPFYHGTGLHPEAESSGTSVPLTQTAPVVPLRIAGDQPAAKSAPLTPQTPNLPQFESAAKSTKPKASSSRPKDLAHLKSSAGSQDIEELPTPSLASRPPTAEEQVPPAATLRRAAEQSGPAPDPSESRTRVHYIRDGDTLELLAERFLGDRVRWQEIRDANRDILLADDVLPIGKSLQIPPRMPESPIPETESESTDSPLRPGLVPIEWK